MTPTLMADCAAARRHAALRWLGAPLLLTGLAGLVSAILAYGSGGSGWNIALGFFGTGMGLATFGANNDAALAMALRVSEGARGEDSGLPPALVGELREELARDRAAVLDLRESPRVAMALPAVAILVQGLLAWRLLGP